MMEKIRITGKLLLIIICTICLIYLIHKDEKVFRLRQPVGEGMAVEDVLILLDALNDSGQSIEGIFKPDISDEYLDYKSYLALLEVLQVADNEALLYRDKYRESFYLLKEDWYRAYDMILELYGMEDEIYCKELHILTGDDSLPGKKAGKNSVLTDTGVIYEYRSESLKQCKFQTIKAYVKGNTLLTLKEITNDAFTLENVWVMEKEDEAIRLFTMGYEVICPWNDEKGKVSRESIADITFAEGVVRRGESKEEKVSGKLLRLSDTELELEGRGTFEIDAGCKVYRLYEQLAEQELSTLQLGYDFADYVIADGKVCGVLVLQKENMESIRVAIRNNEFASLYHEKIEVAADCDMEITYGPYEKRKSEVIKEGESILLDEDSEYLKGDRVMLKPLVLSGKIQVFSLSRNQGIPSYRGMLQIAKSQEGLTMINEVMLEEYLYSVVPSEMPASYPSEALKAQAICARTYAYRYLITPGLGGIGANVDDSVGYQVYNNIAENVNSTKAVKETAGLLLFYEGEPVNTYYYSTSCGFGTDAGVWQESNVTKYPYLASLHINKQKDMAEDAYTGKEMWQENRMDEYLRLGEETDYEYEEPWYRWSYSVEELDTPILYERLYSRFCADNTKVLTLTEGDADNGQYESREPEAFEEIYDIVCLERRDGGVMDELIFDTDSGIYKVISEYNIRYILNNGGEVTRQDESEVACGMLLPSAYITIEAVKEKDVITGYEIVGGGYGHGVGMSQNGAKNMAEEGMSSEDIITFFYPECELRQLYESRDLAVEE